MANDSVIRGSIGKYYKDMFPANSNNKLKESKSEDDEDDEKLKLSKHTSAQEMDLEDFFNQKSGTELVPKLPNHTPSYVSKNKVVAKPASCPRNRRRSRQDRNKSKPKKPNVLKELGPGTTIIVIQKSEDSSGNYNRKDIDDFTGLEEEVLSCARMYILAAFCCEQASSIRPSVFKFLTLTQLFPVFLKTYPPPCP